MTEVDPTQTTPKVTAELQDPEATPEKVVAPEGKTEVKSPEAVTTPLEKTFTEAEFNRKIQSILDGHKGTVDKMRKDTEALDLKIEELEDQKVEGSYENWLKILSERGLDNIDPAKSVAERDKETRKAAREIERERSKLMKLKAELDEAGKGKAAYGLAKQYELGEDVVPELLKAENDYAMRVKALELYSEQLKGKLQPTETPTPKDETVKGIDLSKLSEEAKLGWAMEQALKSK